MIRHRFRGIALARERSHRSLDGMKNSVLSRPAAALAGGALLLCASCSEKQETSQAVPVVVVTPAPAVPAATSAPSAPASAPAAGSPDVSPVANAALDAFKKEIESIKTFMEKNQGSTDPSVGLANLRELVRRSSSVPTEGLPGDLASAFKAMSSVMQRVQTTLDSLPVPVEKLQQHLKEQQEKGVGPASEAADKVAAFQKAMEALSAEGTAASAKLKEVGAKYGIASLDLGGK
jgi:hypothetical protein